MEAVATAWPPVPMADDDTNAARPGRITPYGQPIGRFDYERALRDSDLSSSARLIMLTLATWADAETGLIPKRFSPSLSTLAAATDLDRSTIARHLIEIERAQWVARRAPDPAKARAQKERTRYRLTVPASRVVPPAEPPTSRTTPPELVAPDHTASRTTRHKSNKTTTHQSERPGADDETRPQMTQQQDPRADLLARLSTWHPGREREALDETIRRARSQARDPIGNVIGYVAAWPDEQLSAIRLPPATIPFCGNCDNGFIVDPTTRLPTHRCPCRNPK